MATENFDTIEQFTKWELVSLLKESRKGTSYLTLIDIADAIHEALDEEEAAYLGVTLQNKDLINYTNSIAKIID